MTEDVGPNPIDQLVTELIRNWRALIGIPLISAVVAVLASLIVPAEYEGVAMFSPAEEVNATLPGNLLDIAAEFGVSAGSKGYNVYYFAQVAQSREVLRQVVRDTISISGKRIPVLELLGLVNDTTSKELERGIRRLDDRLTVRTDDQSNLITLRMRGPSPESATALTAAVLDALNAVTTSSIQSGGSAERRFAEAQADSAREALRVSENQHRDFLNSNRNISSSPSLQFEDARLRRQIQIRQDIFLALVNQVQAAKLREVRNTPSIALIQPPQASPKKVWPKASVWGLLTLVAVFTIVATWLYVLPRRGFSYSGQRQ